MPDTMPAPSETYTVWLTAATVIQALCAIAVCVFTWFLVHYNKGLLHATIDAANAAMQSANAASRAADVAAETLHTTERADVQIVEIELKYINSSNAGNQTYLTPHTVVEITYKNVGRTRADHVMCLILLIVEGGSLDGTKLPMPNVIGPGVESTSAYPPLSEGLPAAILAEVLNGTRRLLLSGKIVYLDVFKKEHSTKLDAFWNPELKIFEMTRSSAD